MSREITTLRHELRDDTARCQQCGWRWSYAESEEAAGGSRTAGSEAAREHARQTRHVVNLRRIEVRQYVP